jgi:hypothetical protein
MAKGGSLKAALIQQQDRAARKAAQLKVQEAIERKEKSMNGGGNKQKSRKQSQLETSIVRNEALSGPITESLKKPARKPRQLTYPFDKTDTILLVGEGDFTFTLSLLSAPHSHPSHLVLATSYDSQQDCYSKYPNAQAVVEKIIELGGRVEWKVDAGGLERCKAVGKSRSWSRIVFNFPHAGKSCSSLPFIRLLSSTFRTLTLNFLSNTNRRWDQRPRSKHPDESTPDPLLFPIGRPIVDRWETSVENVWKRFEGREERGERG